MSLSRYREKRHFKHTSEPKGKVAKNNDRIFVIQKHAASHLHYDFRLALNGVLKSWAVPKGPCLDPSVKRLAVEVEDHPLEYATFEGTIPAGQYGAGEVIVWDFGVWDTEDDLGAAYKKGAMVFTLKGHKVTGGWKLIRLPNTNKKPQWLLMKAKDKYARKLDEYDVTIAEPHSVLSDKTLPLKSTTSLKVNKKSVTKRPSTNLRSSHLFQPELATLSSTLPQGDDWIYETKFDGYRILAFIEKKAVKLISRNNLDWSHKFPTIKAELEKLNLSFTLLDGEIVVLDENNKSNFQSLQNLLNQDSTEKKVHYFVFDLPIYQGKDLCSLPLLERKKLLESKIFKKKLTYTHYTEHLEGDPATILETACKQGLEGIIAKFKHSQYRQARTEDWLKLKCQQRQEFVVVGYTEPAGSRQYFGSLLLAYNNKKKQLIYAGHVGTGFNHSSLKMLYNKLASLEQTKMPLTKKLIDPLARKVHWVNPQLVVEVKFTEWTLDGILRHPSYQGLRIDKSPQEITRENSTADVKQIKNKSVRNRDAKTSKIIPTSKPPLTSELTHPDKILYQKNKITKLDLANYYEKVANYILPYIKNRPISILRCPAGGEAKCFLQKHWAAGLPEGLTAIIISNKTEPNKYLTLNNKEGLIGLAQLAVLEIHPWASSNDKLDYPDQMIFDLDPDEKISWKTLCDAAFIIHETLDKLGLINFLKLTGGKGLHIVLPLQRKQSYDEVKKFTKQLAEKLSQYFPKLFTANMSKKNRSGKIFIDYLRNEKEATAIAAFSPRHDENASIAVPITWKKLSAYQNSKAYNIKTIDKYLSDYPRNPWEGFNNIKQSITKRHYKILQNL